MRCTLSICFGLSVLAGPGWAQVMKPDGCLLLSGTITCPPWNTAWVNPMELVNAGYPEFANVTDLASFDAAAVSYIGNVNECELWQPTGQAIDRHVTADRLSDFPSLMDHRSGGQIWKRSTGMCQFVECKTVALTAPPRPACSAVLNTVGGNQVLANRIVLCMAQLGVLSEVLQPLQ